MTLATRATAAHPSAATPGADPAAYAHELLVERLNRALRRPADFGGLPAVRSLLDRLAADAAAGTVWMADTNARLSGAALLRHCLTDPEVHVAAAQYAEDAHHLSWLRPDRTLPAAGHAALVEGVLEWARADRDGADVVAAYGPPSVTFGDPDPRRPKTLGYVGADGRGPLVSFHLGHAPGRSGPVLLAARIGEPGDSFFCSDGGSEFTPSGDALLNAEGQ
ncbi:hypothetical protein [Streptomyces sp. NBC_00448]|uniref:hypothetical protein n=1 Tax=Streptomyces sp. NBC_00448 TaxID=2903652 RepID=UPI002E21F4F2